MPCASAIAHNIPRVQVHTSIRTCTCITGLVCMHCHGSVHAMCVFVKLPVSGSVHVHGEVVHVHVL